MMWIRKGEEKKTRINQMGGDQVGDLGEGLNEYTVLGSNAEK